MTTPRYLLGAEPEARLEEVLQRLSTQAAWQPFDERVLAFVSRFSQRLLTSPEIRRFPELAALGHWFRGAQLRDLAQRHGPQAQDHLLLGRGLAFHLAPSNVDSVFMYSWLLSLLAGNVNLVRVSQQPSEGQDFLIEMLRRTLDEEVGEAVRARFVLLTYAHDERLTGQISQACMLRVIWGGDATVQAIRAIPLRPTAVEVCFPDRFSACALQAQAVLEASDAGLDQLAADFFNDAFWFAQQACSSPRLVAWIGTDEAVDAAAARFWPALRKVLERRQLQDSEAACMARLAASFSFAAAGLARSVQGGMPDATLPTRLQLDTLLGAEARALHCGHGLFLEVRLPRLAALAAHLSDKEQTLAVHGFTRETLLELVQALPARSLDRLCPIGQALAFAPTWDGVDLISAFSRKLLLPPSCHA